MNIEDDPDKGENIFVIIEGENIFMQARAKGVVNKNFLMLDNQSTVNQIANPRHLKNIGSQASQSLYIATLE